MSTNADIFDRVADRYDEKVPFFETLGRKLVAWADLEPNLSLLDIGAGRGAVSLAILDVLAVHELLAVDVSPEMVRRLTELDLPDFAAQCMDVQYLALPDASFDAALSGFTFHILPDQAQALGEVHRVLRPGGTLCISVPGPDPADNGWHERYGDIYAEFRDRLTTAVPVGMVENEGETWEELAARTGFHLSRQHSEPTEIPLATADDHWDWLMSHGNHWLCDALDPADATESQAAVMDSFAAHHPTQGRSIIVAPMFLRFTRA